MLGSTNLIIHNKDYRYVFLGKYQKNDKGLESFITSFLIDPPQFRIPKAIPNCKVLVWGGDYYQKDLLKKRIFALVIVTFTMPFTLPNDIFVPLRDPSFSLDAFIFGIF